MTMKMKRYVTAIAELALWLMGLGCSPESQNTGPQYGTKPKPGDRPVYRFAVHPLHNPAKLMQAYQPLIDYLNGRLQGARLALEASRDYARLRGKVPGAQARVSPPQSLADAFRP